VSARDLLRSWVEELTDEEAETVVRRWWGGAEIRFAPMSREQWDSIERGIAQTDAGLGIPHAEVMRRFRERGLLRH
jgi:predicted transcriptional regulator